MTDVHYRLKFSYRFIVSDIRRTVMNFFAPLIVFFGWLRKANPVTAISAFMCFLAATGVLGALQPSLSLFRSEYGQISVRAPLILKNEKARNNNAVTSTLVALQSAQKSPIKVRIIGENFENSSFDTRSFFSNRITTIANGYDFARKINKIPTDNVLDAHIDVTAIYLRASGGSRHVMVATDEQSNFEKIAGIRTAISKMRALQQTAQSDPQVVLIDDERKNYKGNRKQNVQVGPITISQIDIKSDIDQKYLQRDGGDSEKETRPNRFDQIN